MRVYLIFESWGATALPWTLLSSKQRRNIMKKHHGRWSVWIVVLAIALCMFPFPAQAGRPITVAGKPIQLQSVFENKKIQNLQSSKSVSAQRVPAALRPKSLIVQLTDAPLSTYQGGTAGLKATAPQATGAKKMNVRSAVSQDYLKHLQLKQNNFISAAQSQIPGLKVVHRYDVIFNGFSLILDENDAAKLLALPGVKAVYEDKLVKADTNVSPYFMGAPHLWRILGGAHHAG
ncbi:MAG: hypothetical protein EHM45_23085, partial [Desulfobacteraceae bacterium]